MLPDLEGRDHSEVYFFDHDVIPPQVERACRSQKFQVSYASFNPEDYMPAGAPGVLKGIPGRIFDPRVAGQVLSLASVVCLGRAISRLRSLPTALPSLWLTMTPRSSRFAKSSKGELWNNAYWEYLWKQMHVIEGAQIQRVP